MREFETGATRDNDDGKYDYEGFFSPRVLERRAAYMHKHRLQADGNLRASDNWQRGMPLRVYMKSAFRHFMDWWDSHRHMAEEASTDRVEEAICALMFNCEGYLHTLLEQKSRWQGVDRSQPPVVDYSHYVKGNTSPINRSGTDG